LKKITSSKFRFRRIRTVAAHWFKCSIFDFLLNKSLLGLELGEIVISTSFLTNPTAIIWTASYRSNGVVIRSKLYISWTPLKPSQLCLLSQLHIFYMHCNKMEFNHDKQCRINSQFEILSRKIYRLNRICAFYASCMLRVINLMDKEWYNGAWYNGIKSITTQLVGFYSIWILIDGEKKCFRFIGSL